MARDCLNAQKKYHIVGGFLSPVSDGYKKKGLLPALHRVTMCKLGVQDSDWVEVDTWEADQPTWTRTKVALEDIETRVNSKEITDKFTNGRPIKIMMLTGGDLVGSFLTPGLWDKEDVSFFLAFFQFIPHSSHSPAPSCLLRPVLVFFFFFFFAFPSFLVLQLKEIVAKFGLLIVERYGTDLKEVLAESPVLNPDKEHVFIIKQPVKNDLSSIAVRELLSQGASVKYLIPDKVIHYIKKNGLYKTLDDDLHHPVK